MARRRPRRSAHRDHPRAAQATQGPLGERRWPSAAVAGGVCHVDLDARQRPRRCCRPPLRQPRLSERRRGPSANGRPSSHGCIGARTATHAPQGSLRAAAPHGSGPSCRASASGSAAPATGPRSATETPRPAAEISLAIPTASPYVEVVGRRLWARRSSHGSWSCSLGRAPPRVPPTPPRGSSRCTTS